MNFIIPMAGAGSRFVAAGYTAPKMFLEAKGKTLLEWSVDSLPLEICTNLISIYQEALDEFVDVKKFIRSKYKKIGRIEFLTIPGITRGQAETVFLAKHLVNLDEPLVIFNIDTRFSSPRLKEKLLKSDYDGVLGAFNNTSDKFSFAKLNDATGFVEEVREKVPISDIALTGLYTFRVASSFFSVANEEIQNDVRSGGEFYIAPMYNSLINKGQKFIIDMVYDYDILGTPDEYESFKIKL